MSEENFDSNTDNASSFGQISEEEVNAFDFDLDKDLKLEGLDDVSKASSFGGLTENEALEERDSEPQFDIDNLLDNIKFDEDGERKTPFFEPQSEGSERLPDGNESVFEADTTAENVISEPDVNELTPSFINDWEETPKDDGNGDWKAPQSYDEAEESQIETMEEENVPLVSEEAISEVSENSFDENAGMAAADEAVYDEQIGISDQGVDDVQDSATQDLNAYAEADSEPVVSEEAYAEAGNDPEVSEEAFAEAGSEPMVSEETYVEPEEEAPTAEGFDDVKEPADFVDETVPVYEEAPTTSEPVAADVHDAGYAKWFSGAADNQYFEIGRQTAPYVIEGNDACQAIHVNCSFDAYGWLVCFDNGMMMSLSDVREYQLRNGGLPDENGVIRYGSNEFPFRGINRIVVYQSVQYFSYGV